MANSNNKGIFVRFILHIAGFLLCIIPPALCTILYFPLWKQIDYTTCIAGGVALILALCAVPLFKLLRHALTSFSSYMMWFVFFLLFFALSKIAYEMTVISFVGFVGNLLGALCFRLAHCGGDLA